MLAGVQRKTYIYKVYDESDAFLGRWDDVVSDFEYSEEMNTAGSTISVELARNSDSTATEVSTLLDHNNSPILDSDNRSILTRSVSRNQVGPGSTINHNYRVDISVYYGRTEPLLDSNDQPILDSNNQEILTTVGSPNGSRRFTGFISDISSRYGSSETTVVTLMSFGFDLDQYVVKSGSNTTVAYNSYDPGNIVRQGMDNFISQKTGNGALTYTTSSVALTSTTVSYTFRLNTFLELLKKAVEPAPSEWYFYVNMGENAVYFNTKPATPNRTFRLGVEVKELDLRSYIEDSVNEAYVSGGETAGTNLLKRYVATPATGTRRRLSIVSDNRVTLAATADILGASELTKNRIQYRSTVEILDKQYDIESIRLGDLIKFRNFGNYVDSLQMMVVGISYKPESVSLQLDTLLPKVSKRIEDIARRLRLQESEKNPSAPS